MTNFSNTPNFYEIRCGGIFMENQIKTKNTYTKEKLIKELSKDCNINIKTVRDVYNALEEKIADILSSVKPNVDVSIRLFEGITIDGSFVPEKTKVNNLTGKVITSKSKIKPKANITRYYIEKLTNNNK